MSFRDVLEQILGRVDGAVAASLVALDGIAIDSVSRDSGVNLDSIAAEFGSFLKTMQVSNSELRTGQVEQFSVTTDRYIVILSEVTQEYYLLLVLRRQDGNYGRARWECKRAQHALEADLG